MKLCHELLLVETVGIAIYSYRYFSFVGTGLLLNNLFVLEPYRGQGIASKLLRKMCNVSTIINPNKFPTRIFELFPHVGGT